MKNRFLYFVFVGCIVAGLSLVQGCKKGDNDPFLSLKSRKARITGEWVLQEGTVTNTTTFGGIQSSETTVYTNYTKTSGGTTGGYSETLTIDKDGTYELAIIDDGVGYTFEGIWFFAGKIKDLDLKNKEAVIFQELKLVSGSFSTTHEGLYGGDVMIIDQLKNKEIIFKGSYSGTSTSGFNYKSTYDRTFEKK